VFHLGYQEVEGEVAMAARHYAATAGRVPRPLEAAALERSKSTTQAALVVLAGLASLL
jgi:hypothetical protein